MNGKSNPDVAIRQTWNFQWCQCSTPPHDFSPGSAFGSVQLPEIFDPDWTPTLVLVDHSAPRTTHWYSNGSSWTFCLVSLSIVFWRSSNRTTCVAKAAPSGQDSLTGVRMIPLRLS